MPNSARNSLRLQANNSPANDSLASDHLFIGSRPQIKTCKIFRFPASLSEAFLFYSRCFLPFSAFKESVSEPYPRSSLSAFTVFPLSPVSPAAFRPVCAVGLFCTKNIHFLPYVRFSVNCIAADRLFFSCAGVEFGHKQKLSRGGSRSEGGKKAKFMKLRSTKPLRAAKGLYIVLSAALCLMGLLLIIVPDFSAQLVGILCGVLLVAFGIVRLVGYFSKDLYRLAFQYDLTSGILLILLGIIMLCNPSSLMTVVCVVLGFFILTDGLFKIQIALDAKRFGLSKWFLILALAVLTAILGGILMFRPGQGTRALMVMFGISLLSEGILNFSTALTAVKIVRNQVPDVIDVEFHE